MKKIRSFTKQFIDNCKRSNKDSNIIKSMKEIKFKRLNDNAILPTRGSRYSSGLDFYVSNFKRIYRNHQKNNYVTIPNGTTALSLSPMERILVGTGWAVDLPEMYELQIRPRSGLALKQGITVVNTPGTIDSDYKNEIGIILINLSDSVSVINIGEKVAQGVVMMVERPTPVIIDELTGEDRGGGFGSTGK